jgi:DNA-directed RNA polymerase subunit RPC12/RpoP
MSEFKFSCPHCEQHLQCNETMSGRQIVCPNCKHLIVIPASPSQAAQGNYQPESGKTWQTYVPLPPPRPRPASPPPPAPPPAG